VTAVAKPHGSYVCALATNYLLFFAQLRDVLPAENSPIVAQKDDHGWIFFPQRAEPDRLSFSVREPDVRQTLAKRLSHFAVAGCFKPLNVYRALEQDVHPLRLCEWMVWARLLDYASTRRSGPLSRSRITIRPRLRLQVPLL
jgi:hypothetical protein